jgi:uncharacterized circularly permuted ATP-grasp superfamily protein/uncharacterized alpha-E superfamily protein
VSWVPRQTSGQQQSQGLLPLPPVEAAVSASDVLLRRAWPMETAVYDEWRESHHRLRPHWQRFASAMPPPLQGLGMAASLDRRRQQVIDRIRQDGVTHNVFSDDGVAARPWSLELLPLIIEPGEWATIAAGLQQRAELLQRLLDDVYGAQRVLHEGLLPPALVLRHPGYLRPLQGVGTPRGRRLHIVAFDITRAADGRWWLMAQRTQGPSGLGYVMHNRLVVSRQFSDAFRELQVQHLASGFRQLLSSLEAHAREVARGATPRIVLLTPGPYSETYFEHAYLARYLGIPLVEGSDLTVLGEGLYMKTVDGLEPVHGVLRRLDDDFCDPLELRPDSALGVPGLVQVVRAGRVVMANALGSAWLESPAVLGFLPGIAQRLLGEPLQMPAVPTWWCGEPAAWADVRAQGRQKVLRSTFPRGGRTSQVHAFSEALIEEDPDAWTLQTRLRFSRAPIWSDGAVQLRPALLRVYAVCDTDGRWQVLPGGMTRVAPREDASLSMQRGGTSLDTWVVGDGPAEPDQPVQQRLSLAELEQRQGSVSSRTGENLFWMGRYTERTEQQLRLTRLLLQRMDDDEDVEAPLLQLLSTLAVDKGLAPTGVPTLLQSEPMFRRALLAGLVDPDSFSIGFNLGSLERTAHAVRERLSPEQWKLCRDMREEWFSVFEPGGARPPGVGQLQTALERLALQLAAATGGQTDRMGRDHGWRLLIVGRLLERLMGLTHVLQRFAEKGRSLKSAGVDALLDLFDSAIPFRARYQRHDDLLALSELLIVDDTHLRSLAGVLRRLRTETRKLPGTEAWRAGLLARLPAEGAGLSLAQLAALDDDALFSLVARQCRHLRDIAMRLADDISHHYFSLPGGQDEAHRV